MSASSSAPARDRLRIAIQKSGRLADPARSLLAACGLSWRQSRDKLFCFGESLPVDLLLVRDDDIPGLIADGVCDLGVVGLNELDEQAKARRQLGLADAYQPLRGLGFGQCRLMIAVPEDWEWQGVAQLSGKRIATSYPAILAAWLRDKGVDAQVVELSGSVEIAPRLGTADLICDLVSSGATLAANQLKPVETLLDSEAVLAGPVRELDDARAGLMAMLLRRLDGLSKVQDRKLLMFSAAEERVDALARLLPGTHMLAAIVGDLRAMPATMRRLAWVQFFSWFALFAMWIYTTAAVAGTHFGSTDPQSAAYNEGANWVGVLFGAYNGFAALAALAIPAMVRVLGLRWSHLLNLWLGGAGLVSLMFIGDPKWLLLSMVGVGFAWASILSLPYALLSDSVPASKMGVYMGIFNFFIVIPQLVAASALGFALRTWLGGMPMHVLVLGGCSLFVAGLCVLRVPSRPEVV